MVHRSCGIILDARYVSIPIPTAINELALCQIYKLIRYIFTPVLIIFDSLLGLVYPSHTFILRVLMNQDPPRIHSVQYMI